MTTAALLFSIAFFVWTMWVTQRDKSADDDDA